MHDKLRVISEEIYLRYRDVELNLRSYSRTVYTSMQFFCEALVKKLYKKHSISLKDHMNLGNLLQKEKDINELNKHYPSLTLKYLRAINRLSNDYKHDSPKQIEDKRLFNNLKQLSQIICEVLKSYGIDDTPLDFEDIKEMLYSDNAVYDLFLTLKEENEKKVILLKKKRDDIEKRIAETKVSLNNETAAEDTDILQLRKEIDLIIGKIEDIDQENGVLIEKLSNEDNLENDEKKKLTETINKNRKDKIRLESDKTKLEARYRKETRFTNNERKYLESTENELYIKELEKSLKDVQEEISNSIKVGKDFDINRETLKNYHSISFNMSKLWYRDNYYSTGYDKSQGFIISNLSHLNSSKTKFTSLYAVVYNLLIRGKGFNPSKKLSSLGFNKEQLNKIYVLQILLLRLIREGKLSDDEWVFYPFKNHHNLLETAYLEIMNKLEWLSTICGESFSRPKLSFSDKSSLKVGFDEKSYNQSAYNIRFVYPLDNYNPELWIEDKVNYNVDIHNEEQTSVLRQILEEIFGFSNFKVGQLKILIHFLNGSNTLGILPTGGGKSLTFYLAVLLQPKIGLIVAPLNSLIKDQVDKLNLEFCISNVANLTSDNPNRAYDRARLKTGRIQFVYLSPEQFQISNFLSILVYLSKAKAIGTIVLDEVHCLSEWGHDFRISYLMLTSTIRNYCQNVQYLGLTATASVNVVNDLIIELDIVNRDDIIYSRNLKRTNLSFSVLNLENKEIMENYFIDKLKSNYNKGTIFDISRPTKDGNAGIVFLKLKSKNGGVEELYNTLSNEFKEKPYDHTLIGLFHGENKQYQDSFMSNKKTLLIATKAFGMGVDKPNVRFTVHYGMPSSREAFYQEAGRAGRDGSSSQCLLLTYQNDEEIIKQIQTFLNLSTPVDQLKAISTNLKNKSDISTIFYFLTKDLDTPKNEAEETQKIYDYLLENKEDVAEMTISRLQNDDGKNRFERYFYILHKLGIIESWNVEYSNYNISFYLKSSNDMDNINHIKYHALKYLSLYKAKDEYIKGVKRFKDISEIKDLIFFIRTWYHDTFIRSRREQLANMYSFIEKHQNNSSSDEIQNELEQFFDLTPLLGTQSEQLSLNIEQATFSSVIDEVFLADDESLVRLQINAERIIESYTNPRIDLYLSLIHLRQGTFLTQRNGKERFDFMFKDQKPKAKKEIIRQLKNHYAKLDDDARLALINTLENDSHFKVEDYFNQYQSCKVLNGIIVLKLDQKLEEIWREKNEL